MKTIFLTATIFVILSCANVWAVSDTDIQNSVLKHYPLILAGYDKIDSARGGLKAAQGAFDIRLKQEFLDYSRGYYDGKYASASVERQNRLFGSKVYGGYRRSYRDFESYNGNQNTAHNGEFFAGLNIPLLEGRAIDENRLGEMLANYDFEESKIYLEKIKIKIQQDALKAYWNWIGAAKTFEIYSDLYELSLVRDKQLQQKFKTGDIAKIIVVENKKNLLTRKNDMILAETEFRNSAIYLSLFYRDENANPIILGKEDVPTVKFVADIFNFNSFILKQDSDLAINERAEIKLLRNNRLKETANLKYANNLFQPKLDLNIETSKDVGDGNAQLTQSRNKIGLQLSVPLQFSKASGSKSKAQSNISALDYEERLIQDRIKTELKQIHISIQNNAEMLNNLKEEVVLAQELEKAERKRFKAGDSNFFVVNLREQISADSKIKKIEAWVKLQNFKVDYKAARFKF